MRPAYSVCSWFPNPLLLIVSGTKPDTCCLWVQLSLAWKHNKEKLTDAYKLSLQETSLNFAARAV